MAFAWAVAEAGGARAADHPLTAGIHGGGYMHVGEQRPPCDTYGPTEYQPKASGPGLRADEQGVEKLVNFQGSFLTVGDALDSAQFSLCGALKPDSNGDGPDCGGFGGSVDGWIRYVGSGWSSTYLALSDVNWDYAVTGPGNAGGVYSLVPEASLLQSVALVAAGSFAEFDIATGAPTGYTGAVTMSFVTTPVSSAPPCFWPQGRTDSDGFFIFTLADDGTI